MGNKEAGTYSTAFENSTAEVPFEPLHARKNDGMSVSLLFRKVGENQYETRIDVDDTKKGEYYSAQVDPSRALYAFYHPDAFKPTEQPTPAKTPDYYSD